jgi:phosphate transport system permease protein
MSRAATILNRAKRLDRVMDWVISLGGLTIIAAVLGILVFIGKEAFPLFRAPRSQALALAPLDPSTALLADETGRAFLAVDPEHGIRLFAQAGSRLLATLEDGPALPWKGHTALDAHGQLAVLDAHGRIQVGQLSVDRHGNDLEPATWTPAATWVGNLPAGAVERLLDVRVTPAEGLAGTVGLRLAALDAQGGLVWAEAAGDATALTWAALPLPSDQHPTGALWSGDGHALIAGTREGQVFLLSLDPQQPVEASATFGQPVTALGYVLGQTSVLVGGAQGELRAYQVMRKDGTVLLQAFHRFQPLTGPVTGFMASLRDKRFLAWSPAMVAVDHLTTERRLFSAPAEGTATAALAPRGDFIFAAGKAGLRGWTLDAPHPEISAGVLWGKVHYESYDKPEYVWQSSGGTDDFEPKLSLVPLVFGTLKGTLYAMLFALPLAILGALYTSQFASPRLRDTIKPMVEIMAALPSVVLGFLAGLVLAPLFERGAIQLLLLPVCTLLVVVAVAPLWARLPRAFRLGWGTGREVAWLIPVLLLGLVLSMTLAPAFERTFLLGDFRAWLLQRHGLTYDQRNSLVVGFAMGFAVIPIIFTISEDALSAVPKSLTSASLACGASPWQTAWRVVLPTASPGIFSAVMVGLGRAIGETMIVLMATGNTPVMDWSPFNGMRTLAANIAVETPEAPLHGSLYRLLFFTALLLFGLTFLLNTVAELVRQQLRKRYESF